MAIAIAALTMAGCSASSGQDEVRDRAEGPQIVEVQTITAESQVMPVTIDVTGSFAADESSDVAPETDGQVISTPVDVGSYVRKGAVLVRLDDRDSRLRLAQAEAARQQAEAALRQAEARVGSSGGQVEVSTVPEVAAARANYESALAQARQADADVNRYEGLMKTGDIARTVYEEAVTRSTSARAQADAARQQYEGAANAARQGVYGIGAARAAVASAAAQAELAKNAAANTVIRAPMDGYISERSVSVGEYVTRSTKIATLLKIVPIRLNLQVPEADAGRVRAGLPVTAIVQAFPDRTFEGKVTAINPAIDPNSRAFTVQATFENRDTLLRPGMFATAGIQQPEGQPVVLVPKAAVQGDANTDSYRVYVVQDGRVSLRVVEVGRDYGGMMAIASGLEAGERIAVSNIDQLYDSAPVRAR
jgi:multidrug efflux pump subunit AcrA (membrane-fusion protein)